MTEIFKNLQSFILKMVQQVQKISPWLALAAVIIAGLMYAFGGQQMTQLAKSMGWRVIVGLLIIWGAAAIVNTLIELGGTTSVDRISIGMLMQVKNLVPENISQYFAVLNNWNLPTV